MPPAEDGNTELTIDKPRLLLILGVELLGVAVIMWGIVELRYWHNNPLHGELLIPVGSLVMTAGSIWFAKVYGEGGLLSMFTRGG